MENEIIWNEQEKTLRASIRYPREACPFLTQWKNATRGEYVLGLEPGNTSTEGRALHREHGTLPQLQPQETRRYEFVVDFSLRD